MKGSLAENKVAAKLRELGYLVAKLRHEEGPGDLLAIPCPEIYEEQPGYAGLPHPAARPLLVEVKGTWEVPWTAGGDCFGPDRRHGMHLAEIVYGVEPILAWWPPGIRGGPIWIPPEDWPA